MSSARFFRFFRYLNAKTIGKTLSRAFQRRLVGLSAEMAYNAMLALFPAIIAILTAISLLESSIRTTFVNLATQLEEILPEQVWILLLNFVKEIRLAEGSGWFSVSFAAAIWVFSGALSTAMNALDQIHQVPREQRRPFWKAKLISLVLTVGTILLLITASFLVLLGDLVVKLAVEQNWDALLLTFWRSLNALVVIAVIITATAAIIRIIQETEQKQFIEKAEFILKVVLVSTFILWLLNFLLSYTEQLIQQTKFDQTISSVLLGTWRLLSWPVALGIVATAFAFIYRFGPSRWLKGTPIVPGAILAAISWAVVSALFRLYVTNFGQYNKVYGAVGAVIVLMLWLYISSLVMLLGDQLNATVGDAMKAKDKRKAALVAASEEMARDSQEQPDPTDSSVTSEQ